MKQTILVMLTITLVFTLANCDNNDDKDKYTPLYPNPVTITQNTTPSLAFAGNDGKDSKVTIRSDDKYTDAEWDAIVKKVVAALNTAYTNAPGNADRNRFRNVFSNDKNAQIVMVNNLANNWEVNAGEIGILYLKTGSIATANYVAAAILMEAGVKGVGKVTPTKDRVFLANSAPAPDGNATVPDTEFA